MPTMIQPTFQVLELPPDEQIVAFCEREPSSRYYVYPSKAAPLAFIKSSDEAELRNHQYVYEVVAQMPLEERSSLHVPQIYRCISSGSMVYIIMEYIEGQTFRELLKEFSEDLLKDKFNQIYEAVNLLLSIRIPQDVDPGPVGGGIIKHPVFKDGTASIEYKSIDVLQQHMNKVANRMPNNNCKIDFSDEKLCLCFSDLNEGNFIFTRRGYLYLIDFEGLSYLPTSFMTYALNQPRPICKAIREKFSLPTKNLNDMEAAGYFFMISWRLAGLESEDAEYEKIKKRQRIHKLRIE